MPLGGYLTGYLSHSIGCECDAHPQVKHVRARKSSEAWQQKTKI